MYTAHFGLHEPPFAITPDPALMASEEMTELSGYRAASRMLDLPDPATAFVAASMLSGGGQKSDRCSNATMATIS